MPSGYSGRLKEVQPSQPIRGRSVGGACGLLSLLCRVRKPIGARSVMRKPPWEWCVMSGAALGAFTRVRL